MKLKLIFLVYCEFVLSFEVFGKHVDPGKTNLIENHITRMKSNMNLKINPCINFIDYSCGNYKKDNNVVVKDLDYHWKYFVPWLLQNESELSEVEMKIKKFYGNCLKHYYGNKTRNSKNWLTTTPEQIDSEGLSSYIRVSSNLNGNIFIELTDIVYDFIEKIRNFNEWENTIKSTKDNFGVSDELAAELKTEIIECSQNLYEDLKSSPQNEEWYQQLKKDDFLKEFSDIDWVKVFSGDFNLNLPVVLLDQVKLRIFLKILSKNFRAIHNSLKLISLSGKDEIRCSSDLKLIFRPFLLRKYSDLFIDDFQITTYKNLYIKFLEMASDTVKNSTLDRITEDNLKEFANIEKEFSEKIKIPDSDFEHYKDLHFNSDNYIEDLRMATRHSHSIFNYSQHANQKDNEFEELLKLIAFQSNRPLFASYPVYFQYWWEELVKRNKEIFALPYENPESENCEINKIKNSKVIFPNTLSLRIIIQKLRPIFNLTFDKYLEVLKENPTWKIDEKLQEVGVNSKKAYFIDFMQNFCSAKPRDKLRVIYAIRNEKFSDVFDCPKHSPMSPEEKCL